MPAIKSIIRPVVATLAIASFSNVASAGMIQVEKYKSGKNDAVTAGTLGGYTLTNFSVINSVGAIDSLTSPVDGSTVGITSNDSDGKVDLKKASNTDSWWKNKTSDDYNVFVAHHNLIEILLPENTLAFAFNVGANFSARAWFKAYDQDGSQEAYKKNIRIGGNKNKTPGYGLYADNSSTSTGSCNYISKLVVDPNPGWGLGNFAIAQDTSGNCSTQVPEPGSIALLGLGLIGLRLIRSKQA